MLTCHSHHPIESELPSGSSKSQSEKRVCKTIVSSLKAVWDGEESTRVHKSPGVGVGGGGWQITSSFASSPVICVPNMRSGASS